MKTQTIKVPIELVFPRRTDFETELAEVLKTYMRKCDKLEAELKEVNSTLVGHKETIARLKKENASWYGQEGQRRTITLLTDSNRKMAEKLAKIRDLT